MISHKEFLVEARGVFNSEKTGANIFVGKEMYSIMNVGLIHDWNSFKKDKKIIVAKGTKTPRFFSCLEKDTKIIYLVGGAKTTRPGRFDSVAWSTVSGQKSIQLKPQDFGKITDEWLNLSSLRSKLFAGIDSRSDVPEEGKDYLKSLFDYYITGKQVKFYDAMKANRNSVLKDYSEIIGPVWFLTTHHSSNGKIFIPDAGNEPLIDSIVSINNKIINISSKVGGGKVSNTIKFKDIFDIISKYDSTEKKKVIGQYPNEFEIIKKINNNGVAGGIVKSFAVIEPGVVKKISSEINSMLKKSTKDLLKNRISDEFLTVLLTLYPTRSKNDLQTQVGAIYLMGQYVANVSKRMHFTELANEVVNGEVSYIIAESIDDSGIINFKIIDDKVEFKEAYIRNKNTVTRLSDRLGLQIK